MRDSYSKINMSTFSGLRLALFFVTILPAMEKTCFDGTEVAGMQIASWLI